MENTKQIVHEINGKKYILFEFNSPMLSAGEDLIEKANGMGGIIQKADIKPGLFSRRIEITVLIPEENARKFSSSQNID